MIKFDLQFYASFIVLLVKKLPSQPFLMTQIFVTC